MPTATSISLENCNAALLFESDDGLKPVLNDKQIYRGSTKRRIEQCQDYARVRLSRSQNHLKIKLAHMKQTDVWDPWDLAVGIWTLDGARREAATRGELQFMQNPLLGPDRLLLVALRLFSETETLLISFSAASGMRTASQHLMGGRVHSLSVVSAGRTSAIALTFMPLVAAAIASCCTGEGD